jgi:VWFA-related protein
LAQQPDNTNNLQNTFGFSLERPDKKKKRKSMQAIADRRPDEIGLVRIDTALVVNEILVQDKKGAVIRGLQQNDFAVKEDSVPQNIEVFATGGESRIPRSIILIIDYSFSELPYIATSVEAAKLLVDKLNPFDQMALVTDDVELLSDFTSNKELLKEKLDSLKAKALVGNVGRSKQYSALMAALNELFPARTLRPVILFQTDGDQLSDFTGYGNETPDFRGKEDKEPFKRLLSGLEETGATVYTIVPGPCFTVPSKKQRLRNAELAILARAAHLADLQKGVGKELPQNLSSSYVSLFANTRQRDELALERLSRKSGGVLEHLETPADADAVYSSILSQMNNRYVIGYYPTNQERDGMRRRVEIRLRANSDYIIWGRKTYVAPDSGR